MITVEKLLDTSIDFELIDSELQDLIGEKTDYRADIAYVLTTRILTHLEFNVANEDVTDDVVTRLSNLIQSSSLGSDLKFVMGRKLVNIKHLTNLNSLLADDAVVEAILD